METVTLRLDKNMLNTIDTTLKINNFSTRTEFIRDAIRDKLEDLKREKIIEEFMKFRGKAKKKTTYEEDKITREKVLFEMVKEKGWEI